MAAEAAEEAEAALREMGAALAQAGSATALSRAALLGDLELDEQLDALHAAVLKELNETEEVAQSAAGDAVKYKAAVQQMLGRWRLFLALNDIEPDEEPTHQMCAKFSAFMYKTRQRAAMSGRQGLSDSVAEMAQYILAQVRLHAGTPVMCMAWHS